VPPTYTVFFILSFTELLPRPAEGRSVVSEFIAAPFHALTDESSVNHSVKFHTSVVRELNPATIAKTVIV